MFRTLRIPQDVAMAVGRRPLVGVAVCLVTGIALADHLCAAPGWFAAAALVGATLAVALRSARVTTVCLLVSVMAAGGMAHSLRLHPQAGDISRLNGTRCAAIRGQVLDQWAGSRRVRAYRLHVHEAMTSSGQRLRLRGCALARVRRGGGQPPLSGEVELRQVRLEPVPRATNWEQRDRGRMLRRQGIHCIATCRSAEVLVPGDEPDDSPTRREATREAMAKKLREAMPGKDHEQMADLLGCMVFGREVFAVDRETNELFRRTGTIHLLVVSGAQVTIIILFVITLTGARRRFAWWHAVLIAPLVGLFGFVVGLGPSVARALIMAALWTVCAAARRRYDPPSAVAVAVIALLVTDTSLVFHIGAQLTLLATLGVMVCLLPTATEEAAPRPKLWQIVRSAAAGTLGAWIMVTPLIARNFYSLVLLGSLANLVAVPLSGAIVGMGLLASLVGFVWLPPARVLCWVCAVLIKVILQCNRLCDAFPMSFVDRVNLSSWAVAAWLLIAGALIYFVRSGRAARLWRERGPMVVTVLVGMAGVSATVWAVRDLWPRPTRILTFDVGEGQCTLIETPLRHSIIVDAGSRDRFSGSDLAYDVLVPYLYSRGHRHIDLLVISHADLDHYSGVFHLSNTVPIRRVLVSASEGEATYQMTLNWLASDRSPVGWAGRGMTVRLGRTRLEVLSPPGGEEWQQVGRGDNNHSLVLMLKTQGARALLPGDIEKPAMRWLLEHSGGEQLRAEYLQIPHHGRSSSDLPAFFDAVAPQVAVASRAGEPWVRWGQQSCTKACPAVYDTETWGAVLCEVTRGRMTVETFRKGPKASPHHS